MASDGGRPAATVALGTPAGGGCIGTMGACYIPDGAAGGIGITTA